MTDKNNTSDIDVDNALMLATMDDDVADVDDEFETDKEESAERKVQEEKAKPTTKSTTKTVTTITTTTTTTKATPDKSNASNTPVSPPADDVIVKIKDTSVNGKPKKKMSVTIAGDAMKGSTPKERQRYDRLYEKILRKFQKAERLISDCVESHDGFDAYQITAFLSKHATFANPEYDTIWDALLGCCSRTTSNPVEAFKMSQANLWGDDGYNDEFESTATETSPAGKASDASKVALDDHSTKLPGAGASKGDTIDPALAESELESRHSTRRSVHRRMSLGARVEKERRVTKLHYYWVVFKSIFVATVQILCLVAIAWELLQNKGRVCNSGFEYKKIERTLIVYNAAAFAFFIGVNVLQQMQFLRNQGMYAALYGRGENLLPDMADGGWLLFGQSINMIVLAMTVWVSFAVIFDATSVLDLVMNSVALYFILELDQMVIGRSDYKQVERYMEHFEWDVENRAHEYTATRLNLLTKEEQEVIKSRETFCDKYNPGTLLFWFLNYMASVVLVRPIMYTTAFCSCCIVPFFMLWCL